jgi:hypothetical protein
MKKYSSKTVITIIIIAILGWILCRSLPSVLVESQLSLENKNVSIEEGRTHVKASSQIPAHINASYSRPIIISIMTGHYFGGNFDYDSLTAPSGPCMLDGVKLNCR